MSFTMLHTASLIRLLSARLQRTAPRRLAVTIPALLSLAGAVPAQTPISPTAVLRPSPPQLDNGLGDSIAIDGEIIAVGKPQEEVNGIQNVGGVYLYRRPPAGWSGTLTQIARLVPPAGNQNWSFGWDLAIQDGVLVVGAPGSSLSATGQGSLFVYEEPPGGWSDSIQPSARLVIDEAGGREALGASVAIDGDVIVGGATGFGNFTYEGRAYLFERPASGWSGVQVETASLRSNPSNPYDHFGISVGVSGDTVIVGAPSEILGGQQGIAYIFEEPASGWDGLQWPDKTFRGPNGFPRDLFGSAVAIDGDVSVVGSPARERVYVYERNPLTYKWKEVSRLRTSDNSGLDFVGSYVALHGNTVLVGTPSAGAGAVYLFRKPADGWSLLTCESGKLFSPSTSPGAFGESMAMQGSLVVVGDSVNERIGAGYVFDLDLAQASFRNAGTNAPSLLVAPALLGGSLEATVDVGLTGHSDAILFAFEAAGQVTLGGGQTLLCLDQGAGELLSGSGKLAPGPLASFSCPLPSMPGMLARTLSVQALHAFGATPFALSNAYDLTIGL